MKKIPEHKKDVQHGVALIEAMISIIVLAIGVLGVLGLQLRTLVETQQSANRALAVRLAEDFSERVKNNPNAGNIIAAGANNEFTTPGGWVSAGSSVIVAPGSDCRGGIGCTSQQLARLDRFQWLDAVTSTLPNAQVNVFRSTTEQIGMMFAWDGNIRVDAGDAGGAQYNAAYTVVGSTFNAGGGVVNTNCPAGLICHIVYISY